MQLRARGWSRFPFPPRTFTEVLSSDAPDPSHAHYKKIVRIPVLDYQRLTKLTVSAPHGREHPFFPYFSRFLTLSY